MTRKSYFLFKKKIRCKATYTTLKAHTFDDDGRQLCDIPLCGEVPIET